MNNLFKVIVILYKIIAFFVVFIDDMYGNVKKCKGDWK